MSHPRLCMQHSIKRGLSLVIVLKKYFSSLIAVITDWWAYDCRPNGCSLHPSLTLSHEYNATSRCAKASRFQWRHETIPEVHNKCVMSPSKTSTASFPSTCVSRYVHHGITRLFRTHFCSIIVAFFIVSIISSCHFITLKYVFIENSGNVPSLFSKHWKYSEASLPIISGTF